MTVGLIAALAAAVSYAIGSILQSVAADRTEKSGALDPRLMMRMIKQLPYLIGLAADGLGFVLGIVAIQFLPLFLSEALIASSVGITAILAVTFLKVKLSSMEKLALPGLMIGLILLALSAQPEQAQELALQWRWLELAGVVVVGVLALGVTWLPERRAGIGLAVVSGVAFSGMGIAARSLEVPDPIWELFKDPSAYAVVIYGALGLLFFASALQRATVTTVTALVFGIETVLPSLIGILFLGDRTREGLWPLAVVGFVLALICSTILAGQAEPEIPHDETAAKAVSPVDGNSVPDEA
jgi:drug/metabolite transporter (DMT)-like permease